MSELQNNLLLAQIASAQAAAESALDAVRAALEAETQRYDATMQNLGWQALKLLGIGPGDTVQVEHPDWRYTTAGIVEYAELDIWHTDRSAQDYMRVVVRLRRLKSDGTPSLRKSETVIALPLALREPRVKIIAKHGTVATGQRTPAAQDTLAES